MGIGKKIYPLLARYLSNTIWGLSRIDLINKQSILMELMCPSHVNSLFDDDDDIEEEERDPIVQIKGATAILNIQGMLMPKCTNLETMCGFASTFTLNEQFNELVKNPQISKIILYFDSPGGSVVGIPEFAHDIYSARSSKQILGFTDIECCSAAQWLFSACSKCLATPTAIVGSIGVYSSILKRTNNEGQLYIFQAGDKKLFGHPNIEISDEEKNYFQTSVNKVYDLFVNDVSEYRNTEKEEIYKNEGSPLAAYEDENHILIDRTLTREIFYKEYL